MLWIKQLDDYSLVVIHKKFGRLTNVTDLYEGQEYIARWYKKHKLLEVQRNKERHLRDIG